MVGDDIDSVSTKASSALQSRSPTNAVSNSGTTAGKYSHATPGVQRRGSVVKKTSSAVITRKTGGSTASQCNQQHCLKEQQQQQFVPPRIIINGQDVTPLPLTTSWSLPAEQIIDVTDPVVGRNQLLSCGMYIPWMHPERTAEGNNMNTLSSSPKKNISSGGTTVEKQGITANKIKIEIQVDKKNRNDRSKWLTVTLSESLTFTMFHATGSIISSVQENVSDDVKNINNQDKEKPKKQGNVTQSRDRSIQTLNNMQKSNSTAVDTLPNTKDSGCYANLFGDIEKDESLLVLESTERHSITRAALMSRGCLMDVSDGKYNSHRETLLEPESFTCFEEVKASMQKDKIFHSRSFLVRLCWMEETILRDIFHKQILCYRGLPEAETISLCEEISDPPKVSKHEPIIDYLLTYSCSLCKGHKVTSVSWNQVNADILAVGYEVRISSDEDEEARGMVLIWSLCNPTFPHNKMYIESGVTCLAFSTQRPYILSVGTENGSIFLFDINSPNQNNLIHPIAGSSNCCSMSKSAIWELKWICKNISDEDNLNDNRRNYCEFLVSVGSDGRVIEWSTDIGLSVSCTLMTFKHNSPYPTCLRTTTGALCVDFPSSQKYSKADDYAFPSCNKGLAPLTYLVGAEDGKIYECCYANTKQPLDSFTGHEAPVYRIRYHPVNPKLFLTCSEDCTIKLWSENSGAGKEKDQGKFLEEKTFTPQDLWDAVNDVAWSFSSPNVFAIVTEDGRLQLYDISKSPGDPILTHYSNGAGRKAKEVMPQLEHNNNAVDSTFTENESIGQISTKKDTTRPPAFTCVAFHRLCPVLVVGDDIGNVFIFRYSSTALDGLK